MKVLITGGCGFVGSNLAAHALRSGIEVCILDNLSRNGSARNLEWLRRLGRFVFEKRDIRDAVGVDAVIQRFQPDHVMHLAGQVAMTSSISDPMADMQINVGGTLAVLEAVRRHVPLAGVLFASTNKVYGDLDGYDYLQTSTRFRCVQFPNGFDESVPFAPSTPYGCSKGAADRYVLDWAHGFGLRTVSFRHSSMYGGHQYATEDQGWVGWFCGRAAESIASGETVSFTVSGCGRQVRDVLHIDDVVRLYFTAMTRLDAIAGRAFNVGGGPDNALSLLELLDRLREGWGAALAPRHIATRASDQKVFIADTCALEQAIGWRPQVDVSRGLDEMMKWERSRTGAMT